MKWLKHETDSMNSEKMKMIIHEFGFEGYGWFWRIMEIVAAKMDETGRHHYEQPISEWCANLKVKQKKLRLFLELNQFQSSFKVVYSDNKLRIEIPNLLKKRDNYSKHLEVTSKRLTRKSPLDVDVEVDRENPLYKSEISIGKTLMNFYQDEFFKIFEIKPDMNYGRDGKILQSLAGKHGETKLKELIIKFLSSTDQWVSATDRSVTVFKSQVQKLLLGKGVAKMNPQLAGY